MANNRQCKKNLKVNPGLAGKTPENKRKIRVYEQYAAREIGHQGYSNKRVENVFKLSNQTP